MSDLYEVIESEFDLIDDSDECELLEFNFMPIKKAVFKLIAEHKKLQAENAELKKQNAELTKDMFNI